MIYCNDCLWYHWNQDCGDWQCMNEDSEYCGQTVDRWDCCEDYEGDEDE